MVVRSTEAGGRLVPVADSDVNSDAAAVSWRGYELRTRNQVPGTGQRPWTGKSADQVGNARRLGALHRSAGGLSAPASGFVRGITPAHPTPRRSVLGRSPRC